MKKLIKIIYVLFIFIILIQNKSIGATQSYNIGYSSSNQYVYITLNDAKYHIAGCNYMNGQPLKVSLEWAMDNGYGACDYCSPYCEENNNAPLIILITAILLIGVILYIYKNNFKSQKNIDTNNKELPMNWYKFYNYFRLPLGLFINAIAFISNLLNNEVTVISLVIYIVYFSYVIFLIRVMDKKKKNGFLYIKIMLIVETFLFSLSGIDITANTALSTFIIKLIIEAVIWLCPNYIYFNKRKDIFIN